MRGPRGVQGSAEEIGAQEGPRVYHGARDGHARQARNIKLDGALLYSLRTPFGYWEAKDEDDDLDAEIDRKFRKGYPQDNIIFEDSATAVLIQNRQEVIRCGSTSREQLENSSIFLRLRTQRDLEFRKAVKQFKTDLPAVLDALRAHRRGGAGEPGLQGRRGVSSPRQGDHQPQRHAGRRAGDADPAHPDRGNLRKVFDNADFHRENNVARELYRLESTFFTGR